MYRIGYSIAIPQQTIRPNLILIGTRSPFDHGNGRYRERNLGKDRRLKDSLRSDQRYTLPVKLEPRRQKLSRENLTFDRLLLPEKVEGRKPHPIIEFERRTRKMMSLLGH